VKDDVPNEDDLDEYDEIEVHLKNGSVEVRNLTDGSFSIKNGIVTHWRKIVKP
jgi:hypothetical protein